jgi:hypothetical protein
MLADAAPDSPQPVGMAFAGLEPSSRVAVRTKFLGTWASGFEIVEPVVDGDSIVGYKVRRVSDGEVLPSWFSVNEVIPGA